MNSTPPGEMSAVAAPNDCAPVGKWSSQKEFGQKRHDHRGRFEPQMEQKALVPDEQAGGEASQDEEEPVQPAKRARARAR